MFFFKTSTLGKYQEKKSVRNGNEFVETFPSKLLKNVAWLIPKKKTSFKTLSFGMMAITAVFWKLFILIHENLLLGTISEKTGARKK